MRAYLFFSLSLLLAAPLYVSAQGKPAEEQAREKAKEAFKQAEAFYKTGDYEKALDGYKESYLLSQEPILLYNMGQCYRLLKKPEDALRAYKNFLKDSPANTKFAKDAKKFVKELEEAIKKQKESEQANPIAVIPPVVEPPKPIQAQETPTPLKEPALPQAEKPSKQAPPFVLVAGGATAAAMGLGAFSLSKAKQANELALAGDFESSASALSLAKRTGLGADVLLGTALISAGLACLASSEEGSNKVMVAGGVGGVALAVILGGVSLQAAQQSEALANTGDFEASAEKFNTAKITGLTAAVVGGISLTSAGVGLIRWDAEGGASPAPKYAALGTAVGAIAAGATSLSLAERSTQEAQAGDFEASAKTLSNAKVAGLAADALGVTAIVSASVSALLARKAAKKTTVSVSPNIGGATLSVKF